MPKEEKHNKDTPWDVTFSQGIVNGTIVIKGFNPRTFVYSSLYQDDVANMPRAPDVRLATGKIVLAPQIFWEHVPRNIRAQVARCRDSPTSVASARRQHASLA